MNKSKKRRHKRQETRERPEIAKLSGFKLLPSGLWFLDSAHFPLVSCLLPLVSSSPFLPRVTRHRTDDLRISGLNPLISPAILNYFLPVTEQASELVAAARAQWQELDRRTQELLTRQGFKPGQDQAALAAARAERERRQARLPSRDGIPENAIDPEKKYATLRVFYATDRAAALRADAKLK